MYRIIVCEKCFYVREWTMAECPTCGKEDNVEKILLEILEILSTGKGISMDRVNHFKVRLNTIITERKQNVR